MRVKDKVAIVTGAGGDIGQAICLRLAEEGAKVVASDMAEKAGNETVQKIKAAGGEAVFVKADVTQSASVNNLVDEAIKTYGRLDALVNGHGIAIPSSIVEAKEEDFDKTIAVNLKGCFLTCKAAIPKLIEAGGGAIVNMSSISGLIGIGFMTAYNASKGGLNLLTYNIAAAFKGQGIRCNSICPCNVETKMADHVTEHIGAIMGMKPEDAHAMIKGSHPLQRYVKPIEIAHLVLFLVSDEALCINGVALSIDQGTGPYVGMM